MPQDTIAADTILVRSRQLLEADVTGEIVALDVDKGQCYGLNAVASRVWALLIEPMSINDICARLVREFEVDPDTCRTEISGLVEELYKEGLIKKSG